VPCAKIFSANQSSSQLEEWLFGGFLRLSG